jgi:hypothetical protein
MRPAPKPPKGMLAKILRRVGVEPTEKALFAARIGIVVAGLLWVGYTYATYDDVGDKYGNYDAIKSQLPQ